MDKPTPTTAERQPDYLDHLEYLEYLARCALSDLPLERVVPLAIEVARERRAKYRREQEEKWNRIATEPAPF